MRGAFARLCVGAALALGNGLMTFCGGSGRVLLV